jgi:hypothetical protein
MSQANMGIRKGIERCSLSLRIGMKLGHMARPLRLPDGGSNITMAFKRTTFCDKAVNLFGWVHSGCDLAIPWYKCPVLLTISVRIGGTALLFLILHCISKCFEFMASLNPVITLGPIGAMSGAGQ